MLILPSLNSDLGISFLKQSDGGYSFYVFSKKADSGIGETAIPLSGSDVGAFGDLLENSIQKGTRNHWMANSTPNLDIQIFPVPLMDRAWYQKRMKKYEKWPAPTEKQKLKMQRDAKIIQTQGGYLPPHEFLFRMYIAKKSVVPALGLLFSLHDIQRLLRYIGS